MPGTQVTPTGHPGRHPAGTHRAGARPHPGAAGDGGPGADADVAGAVEAVLGACVRERMREAAEVDALFAGDLAGRVADFALRGGKRLRAGFVWWGHRAGGGTGRGPAAGAALRTGAALELIQTCALIHDDLMDESAVRRGAPAVHTRLAHQHAGAGLRGSSAAFGSAGAVLAGDLALSWADDLFAETAAGVREFDGPERAGALRREWRAMRTEMVAGQYLDLRAQAAGAVPPERAMRIARLKSALYTVERPLALGAALAGADTATLELLRSAGRCAGVAFQLRDDLLGAFGDPAVTGKPCGEDVREGKPTYLRAVARRLAREAGDTAALAALEPPPGGRAGAPSPDGSAGAPPPDDGRLDAALAALESTGARAAVEREITRLAELSHRRLAGLPGDPEVARRIGELVDRAAGLVPAAGGERG
ncbi:polyprenyl synthetase family protein [Streptomyces sp. LP05-1]|uniref:Polyprenyl synthetase family protein n=1 Tax=Streptomyces pyxinae TaxID=2970734 RepID=A0ABT2CMC1_9ACTN|nr:polyprenyl synthetase family protein [Streptomyces sp. LP05-1]MCS0638406.1 polyprenyl synthetase family protein [Streptomyces sp. LP05-1]